MCIHREPLGMTFIFLGADMKELPVRKSIRLEGYDYSSAGAYFVTICVKDGHEMLGEIVGATEEISARATEDGRPYNTLCEI